MTLELPMTTNETKGDSSMIHSCFGTLCRPRFAASITALSVALTAGPAQA
jgi:hypothetical protein